MVAPNGTAPNHRRPALPARALSALLIGGLLAIGAASVWYMLDRIDLPGLIAGTDDPWTGMTTDEYLAVLKESQPLIRSDFDVYLVEDRRYASLIYVKEQCTWADVDAMFFVHVIPVSPDILPDYRKRAGSDNLDFEFKHRGAKRGETCWADLPLPGYEIAEIRTGQYVVEEGGFRNIWMGKVRFQVDETPVDQYLDALGDRRPAIRSDFDVHLVEDRLIYVKEQCAWADVDAGFFVHVSPVSPDALPDHHKAHGFDVLDFGFERHGARHGETCWADLPLPGYEIAEIRTGQSVMEEEGGHRIIWEGRVLLDLQVDRTLVDEYFSLGDRQPEIRSNFDVHLVEHRLVYVKEPCTWADVDGGFFVHVVPVSPDALPDHRKAHGFDNFDFEFGLYGVRYGEKCRADLPLPGYEIAEIRTGQYVKEEGGYRNIWEESIALGLAEKPGAWPSGGTRNILEGRLLVRSVDQHLAALVGDRQPEIRSDFDVHLVEDLLIYVKEPCTRDDVDAVFFVHVAPVSPDALPDHRKAHGFDNLGFEFERHGTRYDEKCLAELSLPGYEIAEIRTGQYVEEEGGYRNIWEGKVLFQVDGIPVDEYLAALGERQPLIRSDFDVRLVEDRLIYVKEPCTWADVDATFFVHVVPASPDALSDHRKPHGFDSLDFGFERHGARFGETCWADLPLPGYEITAIRTGQYVKGEDGYREIWKGEVLLE